MNEEKLFAVLDRIAIALEALAKPTATNSDNPNFTRSLDEYKAFDWSSISAQVVARDDDGATIVSANGVEYKRRYHETFGKGLWFSTYAGMEDNKKIYNRLISFKDSAPATPLPASITDSLPQSPPQSRPRRKPPAKPSSEARAILDAAFPR